MIEHELTQELSELKTNGSLRGLKAIGSRDGKWIDCDGKRLLNLSSNDYMGYASDEELAKQFYAQQSDDNVLDEFGCGSTGSRLLSGNHTGYTKLEARLEELYGNSALVFGSGYHANIGILSALAGRGDLILADRLVHASILDGMRLTHAECRRYPHLDAGHLRKILTEKRSDYRRVFIVTESVFSMDGDTAHLEELVELKKEFDLVLYVDEAHAVGVRGQQGLGVAEELGIISDIDVLVGTFGKALAGLGAYAICSPTLKEYLINKSRSLIFTTALPPVVVHWNHWILERMCSDTVRRKELASLAGLVRTKLIDMGVPTLGDSHIVPAIIGDNQRTVDLAGLLGDNGYMALAVRPPTVPPNTARLRFSLSASLEWDDLSGLFPLLAEGRAQ